MEKLITHKEPAQILGISIATPDAAQNDGQISYVQYVLIGCVFFTDSGLQEYFAKCNHNNGPTISDHHSKKYREHGKIQ